MALQCVVLAGGLGTRMRHFTHAIPKPLIPVLGRPFVDWQLELLAAQGVRRLVFSIGYRGSLLQEHVGDGSRWGLSITWVDEGEDLRGTAGALRTALDQGALDEHFFVLYGDSFLPAPMVSVERAWRDSERPALMAVLRNEGRWDASNVVYRDGRVVLYEKVRAGERPPDMLWIDYGISILEASLLAEKVESGARADLSGLMHELSKSGQLAGLEVSQRFYEVGSPEGLRDLEAHLRSEQPAPQAQDRARSR
jgi:NDP-sugar pyrophosphorylase family protein